MKIKTKLKLLAILCIMAFSTVQIVENNVIKHINTNVEARFSSSRSSGTFRSRTTSRNNSFGSNRSSSSFGRSNGGLFGNFGGGFFRSFAGGMLGGMVSHWIFGSSYNSGFGSIIGSIINVIFWIIIIVIVWKIIKHFLKPKSNNSSSNPYQSNNDFSQNQYTSMEQEKYEATKADAKNYIRDLKGLSDTEVSNYISGLESCYTEEEVVRYVEDIENLVDKRLDEDQEKEEDELISYKSSCLAKANPFIPAQEQLVIFEKVQKAKTKEEVNQILRQYL